MYENFKKLCKAKGVKTSDVARATNIAPQTFSQWKKGAYTPKIEKLQQIAMYFDISLDDLIGTDEKEIERPIEEVRLQSMMESIKKLDKVDLDFLKLTLNNLLSQDKYKKENLQGGEVV